MAETVLIRHRGVAPPLLREEVGVHFLVSDSRCLSLPDTGRDKEHSLYLGHLIVDNPRNLRVHVQRILILVRQRDELSLRGSLVDLFITLGDRGEALKRRMLSCAAPVLSKTMAAFLHKNLADGFNASDKAISQVRMSLLSLGCIGSSELIRKRTTQGSSSARDPIEVARLCVEYGQLDVAFDTLEAALRLDPGSTDVTSELLKLYRASGMPERAFETRDYLRGALDALPAQWSDLEEMN